MKSIIVILFCMDGDKHTDLIVLLHTVGNYYGNTGMMLQFNQLQPFPFYASSPHHDALLKIPSTDQFHHNELQN